MTSITSLSEEVLLLAFEQLFVEGRPSLDLQSLRLVCRQFRPIASTLLFRHVALQFPADSKRNPAKDALLLRSQGLLAFLSDHDQIRDQVQTISIHGQFYGHEVEDILDLKVSLISLLPLLSRLKHICISQIGAAQSPSKTSEGPAFLEAVQKLQRPVEVYIGKHRETGGYLHTFNSQLFLDKITCLASLQVKLLNVPNFPRHRGPTHKSFNGIPSQEIAKTIRQNPGLKDLHLHLDATNHAGQQHELQSIERAHALENIGESIRPLRSLTLEGTLQFTQSAWSSWETNLDWAALRNLSLLTESLTQEITIHLVGRCPTLQSLRLAAPRSFSQTSPPNPYPYQTDVTPFLSSLSLDELSLLGFHPKNLEALKESGSKLRRLTFHIREGPTLWAMPSPHMIRSPPKFTDVLLSPKRLIYLQSACPSLEWLALDVLPFHLHNSASGEELCTPMAGHSASTLEQFQKEILLNPRTLEQHAARSILQLFNKQKDVADPIFATLAHFRSLRHLRLFIHHTPMMPSSVSLDMTIRTFLWLQKHKKGALLESLVIYRQLDIREAAWPYIVYEMGKGKVYAEHNGTMTLYKMGEEAEKPGTQKELWSKNVACEERFLSRWERLDPEGFVVPIVWP